MWEVPDGTPPKVDRSHQFIGCMNCEGAGGGHQACRSTLLMAGVLPKAANLIRVEAVGVEAPRFSEGSMSQDRFIRRHPRAGKR